MRRKQHKKMDGFTKTIVVLGSIFCLFIVGYLGYIGSKIYFTWGGIYEERDRTHDPIDLLDKLGDSFLRNPDSNKSNGSDSEYRDVKPFTILLAGVDTYSKNGGRSDTLILAIVDVVKDKVSLVSVPRDTYVDIPGRNGKDKINHSYSYGGMDKTIETLEAFLDTRVDYYVSVNFKAVEDFIDAIGGLEIDVEKDMYYTDKKAGLYINLKKGRQVLSGKEALHYARFRKDSEGDFGRMRRQQQVIKEMLNQTADIRNVANLSKITDVLGDNVRTDISFNQMITLMKNIGGITGSDVESVPVKAGTAMISGVSYVIIDDENRSNLINEIHKRMELEQQD